MCASATVSCARNSEHWLQQANMNNDENENNCTLLKLSSCQAS